MEYMHIYFSGIGGVGLGPLAEIARGAGHDICGSDLAASPTFLNLQKEGVDVSLDQTGAHLAKVHATKPIDWFVYTAALSPDHPELVYARKNNIKATKRDNLLKRIITENNQQLIAVAGTHGKTTTTAMIVWLFQCLKLPMSYLVGAPLSWAPSGAFDPSSEYFIYECDEFDRNFLEFHPDYSVITSIGYDHPDTYPTENTYYSAFNQFLEQSGWKIAWQKDIERLEHKDNVHLDSIESSTPLLPKITLPGAMNRQNSVLAIQAVWNCTKENEATLVQHINTFPGVHRRFEKLADNLYSDYAHHPEEISATLELASELSGSIVVAYQPHQNIRQHSLDYADCFNKAEKVYWLPTYLSREDPDLEILTPQQLTQKLDSGKIRYAELDETLAEQIKGELSAGKLVIIMGAGSIDAWTRQNLST